MNFSFLSQLSLRGKFALYMGSIISFCIVAIFCWMFEQSKQGIVTQLDRQARSLLQQVIITRTWVADHGGLFVVKRPGLETNPFLPDTDIQDQKGEIYLFRNPAVVTRELSQYAGKSGLYKFRLTSLKLTNPANAPLPFEKKALLQFHEQGYDKSKDGIVLRGTENDTSVYRRIVPLKVERSCLQCHEDQGYEEGDIRGALSVIIPMTAANQAIRKSKILLFFSGVGIISLVLSVLYYLVRFMVLEPVGYLSSVAQRLTDGEYNVKARLTTGDELEDLAKAFNKMTDRLKSGYEGSIKALIAAVEARDPYTKGHTDRVAEYAVAIGKEMGLSDEQLDEIEIGAILHDVGKIGIADEILKKNSPLTGEEQSEMATHVQKGVDIVRSTDFLLCSVPAVLYHHERFDGKGYLEGLKGDGLPLMARILAVADSFDAMTTDRPYRKAFKEGEAIAQLEKYAGSQFDPQVVQAFLQSYNKGS